MVLIFLNWWIIHIFKNSWILAFALIFLSFLLIKSMQKGDKKLIFLLFFSTIVVFIVVFATSFKKTDWEYTPTEQQITTPRHIELSNELGKIYSNKLVLKYTHDYQVILQKFTRNAMENLDINLFFLSNHPRERAGVNEFEKYPLIFLPLFLAGLYSLFKSADKIFWYFFITIFLLSGFLSRTYYMGPILYFPLINILLITGANQILFMLRSVIPAKAGI